MTVGKPVLTSRRHAASADSDEVQALFERMGYNDGLPIVPPTEERVLLMLGGADWDPAREVGSIAPRWGLATVEKVAVNAVMAGCLPEHMPILLAGVRAIAQPGLNLFAAESSTGPYATLMVVNGPVRHAARINCGANALGVGARANAAIGRALRLVIINVGGSVSGKTNMGTQGQSAMFTCCIGENEEASPWEPLHVERGHPRDVSTVTCINLRGMYDTLSSSRDAKVVARVIAGGMTPLGSGNVYYGGEPGVLICPEWAKTLADGGYTKLSLKQELFERARVPFGLMPKPEQELLLGLRGDMFPEWKPDTLVPVARRPEDIVIVVVGGAGVHSMHLMTQGESSKSQTVVVTRGDGTPLKA